MGILCDTVPIGGVNAQLFETFGLSEQLIGASRDRSDRQLATDVTWFPKIRRGNSPLKLAKLCRLCR